jgi:phenylpropionate dioxygenase-like ring-hydroxylating dioxygenase large terminal subunit
VSTDVETTVRELQLASGDSVASSAEGQFDWQNCWYPVTFLKDLPRDRPTSFALYDEPLMLFVDAEQKVVCLRDRCAHRAARLSDGRIVDGRIECLYHGWQYGSDGQCVRIPQLPTNLRIPPKACVRAYPVAIRHGMVWIWAGDPAGADESLIPSSKKHDDESVFRVDFQIDLPYDQSYLVENVIDVAHIHIAHDGIRGGGFRAAAKPLEFDLEDSSITGIRSRYKTMGMPEHAVLKGALVEYVAPNLVRFTSEYRRDDLVAGLDLYSLPVGKSRCRLLYRKYSNFTSRRERRKPRWLEHLTQCTILEQDMAVVIGQHEHIERAQGRLGDLWCPIRTSDFLVLEYRKWLDRFGRNLPFYRGYESSKATSADDVGVSHLTPSRYVLHTQICATCSRAHHAIGTGTKALLAAVVVLAAAALVIPEGGLRYAVLAAALVGAGGVAALSRIRRRFERSEALSPRLQSQS